MSPREPSGRPLLAIVPARGGSKGIPRKNMRMIGRQPLIAYTLDALQDADVADRVIVSSEDDVILRWAEERGHDVRVRAAELASDEATISDVAAALADELDWRGDVGVFQPTAPLRRPESVREALRRFHESGADSLASCVRENHLYWYDEHDDLARTRPLFAERVSRQFAHPRVLRETGSIQLVRADALRATREIVSERHLLFELGHDESLDIDTYDDLDAARRALEQGTVIFRLRANARIGSGHLYHCLQLADELHDQRLRFLLHECDPFVRALLEERGYHAVDESDLEADLADLAGPGGNLVINDVLDTTEREVLVQRAMGFSVVNVEDLGPGARFADWVVNALYPVEAGAPEHFSWGPAYATLRDEFFHLPPNEVRARPERLLITFGGTDAGGLGHRCAKLLAGRCGVDIRVIVGAGASEAGFPDGVTVLRHTRNMAAEMRDADVILTSGGRTVYEAAATGAPVAVLAQNAREATHAHLNYDTGVVFLGIGPLVDDDHIVATVQRMLGDAQLRSELSERLRGSIDSAGAARIGHRIRAMLKGL